MAPPTSSEVLFDPSTRSPEESVLRLAGGFDILTGALVSVEFTQILAWRITLAGNSLKVALVLSFGPR